MKTQLLQQDVMSSK